MKRSLSSVIEFAARLVRCRDDTPTEESTIRCQAANVIKECYDELHRLRKAIKPFTDANLLPPDNWPAQCRMRIDNREEDGTEFLSYHGEPEEHLGILPTLDEWRALREAGEPEEKP